MKNNKGSILVVALVIVVLSTIGAFLSFRNSNNRNGDVSVVVGTTNNDTKISCESNQIPLVGKEEHVTKQIREDIDNDGTKELIVIYEKTVPGWEGMPTLEDRFALFSCENNSLVESYRDNSLTFDFINYESGKAIYLNGSEGWYLLLKNNLGIKKVFPDDERSKEIEKLGIKYYTNRYKKVSVVNNKIEEILPGYSETDSISGPSKPEVKIIYEFKDLKFNAVSVSSWNNVEVNGRTFVYPYNWQCEYNDGTVSKQCAKNTINTHTYKFSFYTTEKKNINDAINFFTINPSDNQCSFWLKINSFQHMGCISLEGGKNYAVYTNSNLQSVIDDLNLFIKTNQK